jgi:hypothetical protein
MCKAFAMETIENGSRSAVDQLLERLLPHARTQWTHIFEIPKSPIGIFTPVVSAETYRADRERHLDGGRLMSRASQVWRVVARETCPPRKRPGSKRGRAA